MPENENIDISAVLRQEIAGYDQKIKQSGGIIGSIVETLNENKQNLQDVLNSILAKKGFILQNDVNMAMEAIKKARKDELEAESKNYKRRFIVIGIGLVVIIAGIAAFVHFKNKKK
jgi:uncharacterized membrane protein